MIRIVGCVQQKEGEDGSVLIDGIFTAATVCIFFRSILMHTNSDAASCMHFFSSNLKCTQKVAQIIAIAA